MLSKRYPSLESLKNATLEDLTTVNDIGEVVASNIIEYFKDEDNIANMNKLLELGVNINFPTEVNTNSYFSGKKIVLTGGLDNFGRSELTKLLQNLGVEVHTKKIEPWRFDVARNESLKLVPLELVYFKVLKLYSVNLFALILRSLFLLSHIPLLSCHYSLFSEKCSLM